MIKKITSKDVAKKAGVSQTTVSLILNNRMDIMISEQTRKKVLAAAQELNYVPNQFAQGLKTNRSRLIGLMLPTLSNPFYQVLAQHVEEYAAEQGYNILLCNTRRKPAREEAYISLMESKSADGIIYAFTPCLPDVVLRKFSNNRTVVIGEQADEAVIHTISLDSFNAGRMVARYLIELGHRKIAFITTPLTGISFSRKARMEGVRAELEESGLGGQLIVKEGEFERENNDGSLEIDLGYSLTEELLQRQSVTAIIGVNDMVAFGALNYLTRIGKRVPADISVCGFDNNYLSHTLNPHITTIEHFLADKARMAVNHIISGMDAAGSGTEQAGPSPNPGKGKQADHRGPQLVVRDSTGPVSSD